LRRFVGAADAPALGRALVVGGAADGAAEAGGGAAAGAGAGAPGRGSPGAAPSFIINIVPLNLGAALFRANPHLVQVGAVSGF
jgi:hypothetical protein